MNTRFNYDYARTQKALEQSTFEGRYMLNTPGQGVQLPFQEDAQIRMQTWGANMMQDAINVESDLRGLTRRLNRDNVEVNQYNGVAAAPQAPLMSFPTADPFVNESRATHPAFLYRSIENQRWEEPIHNPQANLEKGFHDNIQTRILEKDYYKPQMPTPFSQN
jgi:hypothetical protein